MAIATNWQATAPTATGAVSWSKKNGENWPQPGGTPPTSLEAHAYEAVSIYARCATPGATPPTIIVEGAVKYAPGTSDWEAIRMVNEAGAEGVAAVDVTATGTHYHLVLPRRYWWVRVRVVSMGTATVIEDVHLAGFGV